MAMSDWDPVSYARVNTLQEYVARQSLAGLELRGDERVLDVGCGDGRVSALVLDRLDTGRLLGVDPSAAMVAAARDRFRDRPAADFEVGSAATLSFSDEFDLVTSFNALHWETRWTAALARIAAALRPGGRAFLVFVCAGPRPSIEDVVTDVARSPGWRSWFEGMEAPFVHADPDAYAAAARTCGFEVEALEVNDLRWDFGGRAEFAAWCAAGLVAWTSRLPPDRTDAFVDDALTRYAKLTGSDTVLRFLQCRVQLRR